MSAREAEPLACQFEKRCDDATAFMRATAMRRVFVGTMEHEIKSSSRVQRDDALRVKEA